VYERTPGARAPPSVCARRAARSTRCQAGQTRKPDPPQSAGARTKVKEKRPETHLLADLDRVAAPAGKEDAVTSDDRAGLQLAGLLGQTRESAQEEGEGRKGDRSASGIVVQARTPELARTLRPQLSRSCEWRGRERTASAAPGPTAMTVASGSGLAVAVEGRKMPEAVF
jgi:hypothetical protein